MKVFCECLLCVPLGWKYSNDGAGSAPQRGGWCKIYLLPPRTPWLMLGIQWWLRQHQPCGLSLEGNTPPSSDSDDPRWSQWGWSCSERCGSHGGAWPSLGVGMESVKDFWRKLIHSTHAFQTPTVSQALAGRGWKHSSDKASPWTISPADSQASFPACPFSLCLLEILKHVPRNIYTWWPPPSLHSPQPG